MPLSCARQPARGGHLRRYHPDAMRGGKARTAAPGGAARPPILSTALTTLLALAVTLLGPPSASAAPPTPFGHDCAPQNGVLFCPTDTLNDRVPSFDDAPLDVDVTLPAGYDTDDGPLPTIVMLHGYGGNKTAFQSDTPAGESSTVFRYNDNYFAKQGYAVVTYSARGFGRSCGKAENSAATPECLATKSYVHLADQRWEARDTQHLVRLLVNAGYTDSDAIGVTGISYGGGQSIELAYLNDRIRRMGGGFRPWTSQEGRLRIAAAWPRWPWSDLVYALVPNGRFLSSPPTPKGESRNPLGLPKESYIDGLFASGLASGTYCGTPPRPPVCNDFSADLTRWFARIQAGEPYDATARRIANEIFEFHQGFGLRQGAAGVAPLLLQSGWTDDLFPPAESLRVYDDLRAEDPGAEVSLQLGDLGHPRGSNKRNADRAFNNAGADFLDRELLGPQSGVTTAAAPRPGSVTAYTQTCPRDAPADGPFTARGYGRLAQGAFNFSRRAADTVTAGGGNPATGLAVDPIAGGADACREVPEERAPGTAVATGPVSRGFTLLGLPMVTARIDTTGAFGQLASRLWDVAPDGQQTLVSRGVYRLENGQDGRIRFQLQGNGYCFANGHTPKLELLGSDAPFLRPSNSAFAVDVSNVRVRLPSAEASPHPALQLSVTPTRTRVGEATRFRFEVTSRDTECATSSGSGPDGSLPVRNARVRFGGVTERTDADGRVTLRGRFSEAGTALARATKPGYSQGRERVRVLAARGGAGGGDGDDGGGGGDRGGTGAGTGGGTGAGGAVATSSGAGSGVAAGANSGVAGGGGLPFTGLGLGLLVVAGSLMALSGAVLRRRLRGG